MEEIEAGLVEGIVVYNSDRSAPAAARAGGVHRVCASGIRDEAGARDRRRRPLDPRRAVDREDSWCGGEEGERRQEPPDPAQARGDRAAGRPSGGGTRPSGSRPTAGRAPRRGRVIRECAARALAGESLRSICTDLNERGIATAKGKQWSPQTLRRILLSARISGQREHQGEIVAEGGVGGDHHAGGDAAAAREADRSRPAHQPKPPAATC